MARRRIMRWLTIGIAWVGLLIWLPVAGAQNDAPISDLIAMDVDAAFDRFYRSDTWFPIRIRVQNNQGSDITGELTARPETSGRILASAYSTPIDLPDGSDKVAMLYVQARTGVGNTLTVELLDDSGDRMAQQEVSLRAVAPEDKLHVVVSGTGADALTLTAVAPAGREAFQARWTPENLPTYPAALNPVTTLVLYDVDSSTFTGAQREALREWVTFGGHLIVVGGTNWRNTTNSFEDLLPLVPDDSIRLDNAAAVARTLGLPAALDSRLSVTTGSLTDDARVLITSDSVSDDADATGVPLVARRMQGAGTVDFMAFDPMQEPLRSWDDASDLWLYLLEQRAPQPGWQRGLIVPDEARTALSILPDINLLPPVASMVIYVLAYVLVIGPVNYLLLSAINRRGWAWVTIPLCIAAFTLIAWTVGFNLRGRDVIVSRLNVVQSWANADTAQQNQFIGLLSPRRATYSLDVPDDQLLSVMPSGTRGGLLRQNLTQSSSDIVQTTDFTARNVTVDGGIFANFMTTGRTEKPALNGSVTFTYEDARDEWQGIVRNDSDMPLTDAILLTRGAFYPLEETLAPGDAVAFDNDDFTTYRSTDDSLPMPSPVEYATSVRPQTLDFTTLQVPRLVMSESADFFGRVREFEEDALVRRNLFVRSVMRNRNESVGIDQSMYLIGWGNIQDDGIALDTVTPRYVDDALYITELESTVENPSTETVRITPDMFTWTVRERLPDAVQAEGGLNDLLLTNGGAATVRLMPIEGAHLDSVEMLSLTLGRSGGYSRNLDMSLWDWSAQEWVPITDILLVTYELDEEPERFIRDDGAIDVRIILDMDAGVARVDGLRIEQTGAFRAHSSD